MYSDQLIKLFFDFYTVNIIRDFKNRKDMIYYHSKSERIDAYAERITDLFYGEVYEALRYSCIREFRHSRYEILSTTDGPKLLKKRIPSIDKTSRAIAKHINHGGENAQYREFNKHFNDILIKDNVTISDIEWTFRLKWNSDYGGEYWADAAQYLLKLPVTQTQKVLWVDKVLDLYHNNGPLLDKTSFSEIFESSHYYHYQSPLDFRANATISELSKHCSPKIQRLVTANMRVLPPALQF